MQELFNAILQGALSGGVYALFALGLSLTYGVMRLVNIAHGDFIALAAYIAVSIVANTGINPLWALPAVVVLMFVIGYLLQRYLLNQTLGSDILPPLLVTFGMSIILQNGLLEFYSADAQSLQAGPLTTASFSLTQDISIGALPLLIFSVAVMTTLAVSLLFKKTPLGLALRATSDDFDTAQLVGIKHFHVYAVAMGIAFAVMAIGGVFMGMRSSFAPDVGPSLLIFSFEAVVIGGMGSLWGTFAGAILLGVAQGLGYMIGPGWGVLTGHLVFLLVLLFKPEGLFSRGHK